MPTVAMETVALASPFDYEIDGSIPLTIETLPGLSGGPPRSAAAVVGPSGVKDEFVVDEVIFRPASDEELQKFLERYDGTIMRDGTPLIIPGTGADPEILESSGLYHQLVPKLII